MSNDSLENKRFIVIDLENEQSNTNSQVVDSLLPDGQEKIIQLGFVVLELGDEPVFLHEEIIHLHYDKPLSSFIKTLTSITDNDLSSSENDAKTCLKRLKGVQVLYQTSRQIVEWGGGDVKCLADEANCNIHDEYGFARSGINAKHLFQMYALANGIKTRGGLSKSMSKLNLPFVNTRYEGKNKGAHWALTDAKNTAILFNELLRLIKKE
jgi:DNA polymerase III alpha subunit (gram-positive type)